MLSSTKGIRLKRVIIGIDWCSLVFDFAYFLVLNPLFLCFVLDLNRNYLTTLVVERVHNCQALFIFQTLIDWTRSNSPRGTLVRIFT